MESLQMLVSNFLCMQKTISYKLLDQLLNLWILLWICEVFLNFLTVWLSNIVWVEWGMDQQFPFIFLKYWVAKYQWIVLNELPRTGCTILTWYSSTSLSKVLIDWFHICWNNCSECVLVQADRLKIMHPFKVLVRWSLHKNSWINKPAFLPMS